MCRKAKCAYLRDNGYCLMHREPCNVLHPDARCHDGAARAIPSKERHLWDVLGDWNLGTAKGRFSFRTRKARGHDVYRTCSRKRRFASLHDAREKAIDLKRKRDLDLLAYECPFCGGYHLTHYKRKHLLAMNGLDVENKSEIKVKKSA